MIKKFKKPSGVIVKYDSNVHSDKYLTLLEGKLEEVKEVKKVVKKSKKKESK